MPYWPGFDGADERCKCHKSGPLRPFEQLWLGRGLRRQMVPLRRITGRIGLLLSGIGSLCSPHVFLGEQS